MRYFDFHIFLENLKSIIYLIAKNLNPRTLGWFPRTPQLSNFPTEDYNDDKDDDDDDNDDDKANTNDSNDENNSTTTTQCNKNGQ